MKQKIRDNVNINSTYQIDKQFLVSLDDIFKQYDKQFVYDIDISCGKSNYTFDNLDEFFSFSDKLLEKIEDFKLSVYFTDSIYRYDANKIDIEFNTTSHFGSRGKIYFSFNDEKYLLMKSKIETLLNNQKVSYSVFTHIPLVLCLDILSFVGICVYTDIRNIVFPSHIQSIIMYTCIIIGCNSWWPPFQRVKRYLFPLNEICFGINTRAYSKAKDIRNFLGITVTVSSVLGILGNIITDFII